MTIEQLFDNKIVFFDPPLQGDDIRHFGRELKQYLSTFIDAFSIDFGSQRLLDGIIENEFKECLHYFRFYISNNGRYAINFWMDNVCEGVGDDCFNTYQDYINRGWGRIGVEDIFEDIPDTIDIMDRLTEQEENSDIRLIKSLKDLPFYVINSRGKFSIDTGAMGDGVGDLFYVGDIVDRYNVKIYWRNTSGQIVQFTGGYRIYEVIKFFEGGNWVLKKLYELDLPFSEENIGIEDIDTYDIFNRLNESEEDDLDWVRDAIKGADKTVTFDNVEINDRVVRGRNWDDQGYDGQGDEYAYGVITGSPFYAADNQWVQVTWFDGFDDEIDSNTYRVGPDYFDLYFY